MCAAVSYTILVNIVGAQTFMDENIYFNNFIKGGSIKVIQMLFLTGIGGESYI
jgi:hypothetical protein